MINSGVIGPEISGPQHSYEVISSFTNYSQTSAHGCVTTSGSSSTFNESATLAGTTVTALTAFSGGSYGSFTSADIYNRSAYSAGGNATLVNNSTGVIGGYPVSLLVQADQFATVTNLGEIDGNVSVIGIGTSTTTANMNNYSSYDSMTSSGTGTNVSIYSGANLSFSYAASFNQVTSGTSAESNSYSFLTATAVVTGVGSLTNGSGATISGNVTVSGPYGASLVNSGTIGGVFTSGNIGGNFTGNIVIGCMVQVLSQGANISSAGSGNGSFGSTFSSTYSGATTLGGDGNLTSTYSFVGGAASSSAYQDTYAASTTQMGVGATLTNNSGGVIGSAPHPMVVVVDAVGPSTVNNSGVVYGDIYIGEDQNLHVFSNSATASADSFTGSWSSATNDTWAAITTSPGNAPMVVPTSFANITTTSFSEMSSYSTSSTSSTVSSPASYSGSGTVYGSINIATSGNATVNNTGILGAPQGGGSLDVVSQGFNSSSTSVEVWTRGGNSTDANISTNGVTATDTFNGISSSTTTNSHTSVSAISGGTASLTNSGTIGGNASNPIGVYVFGPQGAFVTNNGTINGDVQIESDYYWNSTTVEYSTNTATASSIAVTNYSKGTITSQSYTYTNTTFGTVTDSYVYTTPGGNVTLSNNGTVAGEVYMSAVQNALLTNNGQIWQSVSIGADYADNDVYNYQSVGAGVSILSFNGNSTVNTTSSINSNSSTQIWLSSHIENGGNATLINSGTIGLLVSAKNGALSIYAPDGNPPDVTLYADKNVSVINNAGGVILGNVSGYVVGDSYTSAETLNTVSSTSVTTVQTGPVLAGGGSQITTVTVFSSVTTDNISTSSVDIGGTATLTNNGNIGQSFSPSYRSGGSVVGGGGVYLYGQAGATLTNNGIIGVDAKAFASATASTYSAFSVETSTSTQTVVSVNNSLTNTATTNSTAIDIFHSTYTSISTPTGEFAVVTNTGVIGLDELNSVEQPVGTGAYVVANGQAGALITNSGIIQGLSVEAYSHAYTSSEMVTDNGTLTYAYNSAIGGCMTPTGGSEVHTYTQSALAGGGTATIINTGKMLSSADLTLTVTASSYGNATVINQKGALIVGDVEAISGGNSSLVTSTTTKTFGPFGLLTEVKTLSSTDTWAGGTAFVDNAGTIGGYTGGVAGNASTGTLVGGDVTASGVTLGKVLNEATGIILGDAHADSSRLNDSFNSMVVTTGPGTGTGSSPTPSDNFVEVISWTGGTAIMDNFGYIGGNADAGVFGNPFATGCVSGCATLLAGEGGGSVAAYNVSTGGVRFANLTNEQGAYIGGNASANSLFVGVTNNNGNVTSPLYGGYATVINKGIVGGGFTVTSLLGSTLVNAASAQFGNNGSDEAPGLMLTVNGQNSFTNLGTIGTIGFSTANVTLGTALTLYLTGLLGAPTENANIEFMGNTTATNYGIIDEDLVFTNVAPADLNPTGAVATANFTFGQGSVLTGDINDLADAAGGETLSNLTINFTGVTGGGLYQGNIWGGVVATNVTAPGRWILTGTTLNLGQTTINNPVAGGPMAWLQIGTPLNFFLNNPGQLLDVILGQNLDPLEGLDPFIGNSAVNPAVNALVPGTLTSNLISATKTNPIITANITIGPNGGLEGQAIIVGGVANSGYLLPGWMLPNNTSSTLVNLIANTNQILPGQIEISNNYTQSATGTFLTNFAPSINRPVAQFVGTQAGPFAPTTFWLSVAPFQVDSTRSASIVVDGNATVNGTVDVYVQTSGLYVNGDKRTIVFDKGNLTLATTATTAETFPSPFVHFGLATGNATVTTVVGTQSYNTLNVVVQRTSYASVASDKNGASVGVALDSAVPVVANEISGANGYVFPNITAFNNAQDMAGFLSDLDWRAGNASNAGAIIDGLVPSGYAALLAIDSGEGFRNEVNNHLLDARGEGSVGDPLASAFIQAYGMSQRVNSTSNGSGIVGDVTGLSAGVNVQATDAAVVGFAMGWSHTSLGGNQDFGGGINAIQGGIYTTIEFGEFYIDATVWENLVHGTVTRDMPVVGRMAHASYKDNEFRADAEVGYRFNLMEDVTAVDNFGVTPFAAFHYRGVDLGNFSETGAGALGVDLKTLGHDIFQPELGVTADGLYHISPLVLVKPLVGIGVGFGDAANSILAEFQGGGSPFTVVGPQKNGVFITPQAGMQFQIGPVYSLSFTYRGAIGQGRESEGGWITFKGVW